MASLKRIYTGYYVVNGFILGPKRSGQFYIKNNRIYKVGGMSRYYIAGGFVYGPRSRGEYSIIGTKIYGPSTSPPWL